MTQTIEQLTARVRELEEENARLQALMDFDNKRLDQIEDELEDVEYIGPYVEGIKVLKKQLAASQLHAEQLREALNSWLGIASNCSIESGVCGCGEAMKNHSSPMMCGHSPVDMADSVVHSAIQKTDKALSQPSDTSALDTFVAEKVKEIIESHAPEGRNVTNAQHVEMRHKFVEQISTLAKQRDLAVEALHYCVKQVPELATVPGIATAIKESEGSDEQK